jgi:Glycine rich protein
MAITHPRRWAIGAAATSAALAAAFAIPLATQSTGATAQAATSTTLATYTTHGTYPWTVPAGTTTVTFTVFGASGSGAVNGNILLSVGGPGGEARGQFTVRGGEIFEVVVGGQGAPSGGFGFNGGGDYSNPSMGHGGGGSDVRIGGLSNPCTDPQHQTCDFIDRLVVGGGGGGGGASSNGGAGGGAKGADGAGRGGSQEGVPVACFEVGNLGAFGCGAPAASPTSGGGGGGWYGGSWGYTDGGGGAGGSGYVSPLALKGSFSGGTHIGDGRVVISTP